MKLCLLIVLLTSSLLLGLSGCTTAGGQGGFQLLNRARGPAENQKLHTDLIEAMIKQDKLYAALAHVQSQEKTFGSKPKLRLLRANILRKLNKSGQAEKMYRQLIDGQFAGYAEHGLGLIYAQANLNRAMPYLERAVELRPTNARFRNDYGYALMKQGKFDAARLQLATAFQLDDKSELSRNNYVELLLIEGNVRAAHHVAKTNGIDADTLVKLREQARQLQESAAAQSIRALQLSTSEDKTPGMIGGGGG